MPDVPSAVQAVLDAAGRLAVETSSIVGVALAGSYARGAARPSSDVDLVFLTHDPAALLDSSNWHTFFDPQATLIRASDFGAISERRLLLPNGLVVEVGIGLPSWANTEPVDDGTRRVVSDGLVAVYDPADMVGALIRAVNG